MLFLSGGAVSSVLSDWFKEAIQFELFVLFSLDFVDYFRIFVKIIRRRMGNKRIIIMGASSGIGYEVARLFIDRGWLVGLAARRKDLLSELQARAPERVRIQGIDITDQEADQALQYLIAALGGMDIYLHVSGIGKQNKTLDPEIEENTFQTNVVGFGRMVGAVYRYFSQKGKGQIAVVSSIAGTKGLGVAPAYSATKRFQNTYIQALAQLTRMEGCHIDFTDIRPGFVDTALLSGTQHYPMLMRPEKVARQIVSAIEHRRRVVVIDWRYAVITYIWQLIPRWVWERMVVRTRRK